MPPLTLTLFGPLSALIGGVSVRLPTDKARALLAYLALTPDTPLRRETLAGLLWPDQPEEQARQNLRKTASRLKEAVAAHDPALAEQLLLLTKQTIELRSAAALVDVPAFSAHLATARQHAHASLSQCESCLAALEAAVGLFRQGEFLAGLSLPDAEPFEDWLRATRESLAQQQLAALQRLSAAYEQQGAFEKARQYAQWQLQQEPWREDAHRQLMRLLAAQGLRAEAIAQYQACRRTLGAELGVEPAAETEALLTQIMEGSLLVVPTSPAARPQRWPRLAGPLIGRATELARITRLLAEPACRVLTLTGLGGIGKTSLALAVGEPLHAAPPDWAPDGVYFVPAAEAFAPGAVAAAVAEALGLTLNQRYSLADQVEQFLRPKALLLVIDNLESIAADLAWLHDLVAGAAQLKLLVTAREPLHWQTEWRYPVEGLAYPQRAAEGDRYDAGQLFVQVARQVRPDFDGGGENAAAIARICQLVHGWPLALQMAGAWVQLMSGPAIAEQISASLDFLTTSLRGVPPQQQSIRVIFAHTWQALSAEERSIVARLAVFRGGFTLPAAMAVAATSPLRLRALVDKALVGHDEQSGRYTMHALLRQFALEQAQTEPDFYRAAQQSHQHYFLSLLKTYGDQLATVQSLAALATLKAEADNLRQAWLGAAEAQQYPPLTDHLASLAKFYEYSGLTQDAIAVLRQTLAALATQPAAPAVLSANVRGYLADNLLTVGQYDEATRVIAVAQAAARALDDGALSTRLYVTQAHVYHEQGRYEQAHAVLQEAIAVSEGRGDANGVARALHIQGNTYWSQAAYDQARTSYEAGRHIYETLGDVGGAALLTGNIGVVLWRQGQYAEALVKYDVALAARRAEGNLNRVGVWLGNIGLVYVDLGDDERALAYLDEGIQLHEQAGRLFYQIELLLGKVAVYLRRGDVDGAGALHKRATDLSVMIGNRTYLLDCDRWLARLYRAQGRPAEAAQLLQALLQREFRPDAAANLRRDLAQLEADLVPASAPPPPDRQPRRLGW